VASLQVRDLPEAVYKKLSLKAAQEHRSLAQETVVLLEQGLGISSSRRQRRQKLLTEIREKRKNENYNKLPSPVMLIREDRQR